MLKPLCGIPLLPLLEHAVVPLLTELEQTVCVVQCFEMGGELGRFVVVCYRNRSQPQGRVQLDNEKLRQERNLRRPERSEYL